ncbi:choice-of-anchor G family protein, partial [Microbacterium sp. HD4P20]|uniref:choice-of-anchor G family protein n=1 Tax=Microbacterium sp. HD4P20 TaxID=2864874 RepID=UPI001C63D5B3
MRFKDRKSAVLRVGAATTATALALFGGVTAAHAGPGDSSNASGTFLGGSILELLDADTLVQIEGVQASNDGTPPTVVESNTLDLELVSLLNVELPGGIQLPIDTAEAGVVGQYASAGPNGDSVGASGLVGEGGAIGTGVTPLPGVAPGPLSVSLDDVVSSLTGTVGADLVAEIAQLDLTLGVMSASASQNAPAAAVGDYEIAGGVLSFESPTVAGLAAALNGAVGGVQEDLDGVQALLNSALETLLGPLGLLVEADVTIGTTSLTDAISDLLSTPLTSPEYPGVVINLGDGTVTIDLDEIHELNDQPANTQILSEASLLEIQASVLGLLDGLVDEAIDTVVAAIEGLSVTGGATVAGLTVLTIDTTVGALLDGDTTGITLLGLGLTLPGGVGAVVAALAAPLQALVDSVAGTLEVVLDPVNDLLLPALDAILPLVASITVNNQSTSGGVFSETALRLTILPTLSAVTIDLANATVGPNVNVTAAVEILEPTEGEEIVADGGTETADVPVSGTGEPGSTIDVTIPGQPTQSTTVDENGEWEVIFPGLPVGTYTATATQDVDGSTDTVTFSVITDATDADATDADATDADATDADATDADATDADATDADATDADATDADATDA